MPSTETRVGQLDTRNGGLATQGKVTAALVLMVEGSCPAFVNAEAIAIAKQATREAPSNSFGFVSPRSSKRERKL